MKTVLFRYAYYTNLTCREVLASGVGPESVVNAVGEALIASGTRQYYLKVANDELLGPAGERGLWYDAVLAGALQEMALRRLVAS